MANGRSNSNKNPNYRKLLDQMKYEIAEELGLQVGGAHPTNLNQLDSEFAMELGTQSSLKQGDYWGHIATRETGAVGGEITRRLIQEAQKTLLSL